MSDSLSLFEIEKELAELVAAREEATDPEQCAALDNAIRLYVEGQVRKVDGVRAYVRNCEAMAAAAKEEAERQAERARVWTEKGKRFKQFILDVMQAFGLKKLEGRTGTLTVCGNGGKEPVTITDESLVPDELCTYAVEVSGEDWGYFVATLQVEYPDWPTGMDATVRRKVNEDRVREELMKPCPECSGGGMQVQCGSCYATGKAQVAGARLEPRGVYLRVK